MKTKVGSVLCHTPLRCYEAVELKAQEPCKPAERQSLPGEARWRPQALFQGREKFTRRKRKERTDSASHTCVLTCAPSAPS